MRKNGGFVARVPERCPALLRRWMLAQAAQRRDLRWVASRDERRFWARCRRVLDLGCGTGEFAFALANACPRLRVTGVDSCAGFIRFARSRFKRDNLEFRAASVYALPAGGAKYDAVVMKFSLHHMNRPAAVLRRVAEVLAPGGALLISDFERGLCLRWEPLRRWRRFREQIPDGVFTRRLLAGRLSWNGRPVTVETALAFDSALAAYTDDEIAAVASRCGFAVRAREFFNTRDGLFPPRLKNACQWKLSRG